MDFNAQRIFTDHIIAKRISDTATAAKLQKDMDAFRRKQVIAATNARPVYLPLQFSMNAAGQTSPYRDTTAPVGYDVMILGVKSDTRTRDIIVRRTANDKSICRVGGEASLYLRVDDFAGISATTGGSQLGVFYLPAPFILQAGNRLNVEMYKTDTTGSAEVGNIVFIGVRLFNAQIEDKERALVEDFISLREVPETVILKQLINFDTAGVGGYARNKWTPRVEEPLLILGCRTTLRQSMIEVGIQGEPSWTVEPTPIWGVAGEDGLTHDNYQWFSKPMYLPTNSSIEVRTVKNSIDGTNADAQIGKTITWICRTV